MKHQNFWTLIMTQTIFNLFTLEYDCTDTLGTRCKDIF